MAEVNRIYKCDICGNMVVVLHGGQGGLVCCGQSMKLMEDNTTDAALEKHVPVVSGTDGGCRVNVGSAAHPMEEKHYIEWICLDEGGGRMQLQFLKPGDSPVATFVTDAANPVARAYCNLHGVWRGE
jgi:superoxide reductase